MTFAQARQRPDNDVKLAASNACRAKVCGGFARTTCKNKELKRRSESERSRRALVLWKMESARSSFCDLSDPDKKEPSKTPTGAFVASCEAIPFLQPSLSAT